MKKQLSLALLIFTAPLCAMESQEAKGEKSALYNDSHGLPLPIGDRFFGYRLMREAMQTPEDLFASRIKDLPHDVQQQALRHFAQKDSLYKKGMTLTDAASLAKLYTDKK